MADHESKNVPAEGGAPAPAKDKLVCIDISRYTTRFAAYPSELKNYADEKGIKLPSLSSMRGQGLALMSQPEVRSRQ